MNYETQHLNYLATQIQQTKEELSSLPDGKLICSHNGTYYKWYYSNNGKSTYIPKSNRAFAEKLARKKYLTLLLQDLLKEQKNIQHILKYKLPFERISDLFLLKNPEYRSLLQSYDSLLSKELSDWMNSPYPKNPSHPEKLIHQTVCNLLVRSKSESMIVTALHHYKIPFRYENPLTLNTATLYPDFTIRHPKTGYYYYWEHFGMMENPSYIQNCFSKQQLYASFNILPTIQLITTYENTEHPLNTETIDRIIHQYFL